MASAAGIFYDPPRRKLRAIENASLSSGELAVSSLRPLATIALLAAVGVLLYVKINSTEPKLSPELEEWSTSTLEVGGPDDFAALSGSATADAATPPAAGGAAPPFASAQLNPPTAAPAGPTAPPWTPAANATTTSTTPNIESSPVARSAATTPAMPEMPALPGGESDAASDATANALAFDAAPPIAASTTTTPPAADITPTPTTPTTTATTPATTPAGGASMFAAAQVAVEGALDRGELAQALTMLSEWYGDPSLTPAESKWVNDLLAQLAGSVIYEGPPAHRLLPPHLVKDGETLDLIAKKYDVPAELLAKINGISRGAALPPGKELKVLRGPFSAVIDLSERKMTLKLERRYAGQFALEMDPTSTIEEGEWKVDQKNLTPGAGGIYAPAGTPTEDRSMLLANIANPTGQAAVLRGPGAPGAMASQPASRVLKLKTTDVGDVYDILSIGSRITIQR